MKEAAQFIKRMREDAGFREKVNACFESEERLAFLKSEGYDFSPFIQILNNLSDVHQSTGGVRPPGGSASPKPGSSSFLGRLGRLFRAPKASRPDR